MTQRLSKVAKNLNVGIGNLVEFLQKKGITVENNPNTKIDDGQYQLLVAEFSKDKKVKKEAIEYLDKMHRKDNRNETVTIEGYEKEDAQKASLRESIFKSETPVDLRPKINVVGSINLDKDNTLKTEPKEKPALREEPKNIPAPSVENKIEVDKKDASKTEDIVEASSNKEEPKQEKSKEKAEESPTIESKVESPIISKEGVDKEPDTPLKEIEKSAKADVKKIVKPEIIKIKKENPKSEETKKELTNKVVKKEETKIVAVKKSSASDETESVEKPQATESNEPFRLNTPVIENKLVVKGSIDLDAINEKTRPARKSRSQRRKERLDREKEQTNQKRVKEEAIKNSKKDSSAENKNAPANENADDDNKKRKRRRIDKNKVEIDKKPVPRDTKAPRTKKVLKKPVKAEVNEEEVQRQIKETLARLTDRGGRKGGGAKYRREKRDAVSQRQQAEQKQQERESKVLQLTEFVTANDLANMMDVHVTSVIATCMNIGVMVAINQRLDAETINIVADEFGFKTKFVSADVVEAIAEVEDNPEDLLPRPPIVTVMGHVDHGKTSLLDSIRNTNVIGGEAGGITQHIGAYNVKLADGQRITFLDTPGHEAFTAMRARGAKVTDVAIIIVAADDNVMPQTIEAINHASAAGVPIVFAINKIDKPAANPDKIKEKLAEMNYLVEDWGGKYQSQEISAKQGIGITELLEKVLLEASMLDLKANPNRRASGTVVESSLDKGRGYVTTVLVENGTLSQGDILIAGTYYGRIKAMFNERNQNIEKAGPAEPALILGLNGAPQAGDTFNVMESDQEARSITSRREQLQREQSIRTQRMLTLDDIGRRIAIGNFQQLNIIVKGDVDGSVEALADSLIRLSTEEIQINVIHKAVGQISESDVTLAAASDAIIIGFQVRPSLGARREAEKDGIDIRLYSIIYDAIEEVKAAMEGMLTPDIKEEIIANVEVLEIFKISKVGTIAGCMVRDGKIKRNSKIRLIRDGIVIFTGTLDSLKRFKDDVREVASGYECGLNIKNFNDIKVGDVVEAYEEVEVKKSLDFE